MSTHQGAALPIPTPAELDAAGVRLVVAIPMERTIPSESFPGLWAIAQRGYPLIRASYGRTDMHRNHFARALVESDFTHVLMLDPDQLHPGDTAERLARWVGDDPERLVVSGLHFRRGEPYDPLAMLYDKNGEAHAIGDWPADALIRVHAIGHGSTLISRQVFEQIPAPWWCYTYSSEQFAFPTEDMFFCRVLAQHGIAVWVDTSLTAPHLISSVVDADVHRRYLAEHPELVRERSEVLS